MPGQGKMAGRMMTNNNNTGKCGGEWLNNLTSHSRHLTGYTEGMNLAFKSQDIPDRNEGKMNFKTTSATDSPKKIGVTVKLATGGNSLTVVTVSSDKKLSRC